MEVADSGILLLAHDPARLPHKPSKAKIKNKIEKNMPCNVNLE
jgi:hypothetical protein